MPWFPTEQWQEMRAGVDCPMCADGALPENPHSDLVTELSASYARLSRNQAHAGYVVLVAKRHVAELYELTVDERSAFVEDVARATRAVAELFQPVKLDTLMMGHLCPHLHCHVYPQYEGDDPKALVDITEGDVVLSDAERADRIAQLRERLGAGHRSRERRREPRPGRSVHNGRGGRLDADADADGGQDEGEGEGE